MVSSNGDEKGSNKKMSQSQHVNNFFSDFCKPKSLTNFFMNRIPTTVARFVIRRKENQLLHAFPVLFHAQLDPMTCLGIEAINFLDFLLHRCKFGGGVHPHDEAETCGCGNGKASQSTRGHVDVKRVLESHH